MALEIERKFLVCNDSWKPLAFKSEKFLQAYLSHRPEGIVRLRIAGKKAFITIKGRTIGIQRNEWEYEIPLSEAIEMIEDKVYEGSYLEKTRYLVDYEGVTWEIDEFHGKFEGLVLAEVEINESKQELKLPPFAGKEVSDDPRYFNSNLNLRGLS